MSDSYQAVYDAVRSRITGGDISQAVERCLDFSHQATMIMQSCQNAASEYERPSAVFRPSLSRDGDHWCALLGENLHDGVAGFGKSPAEAMWDFDAKWREKLPSKEAA